MSLGVCCHWLVNHNGKQKNALNERALQLGRYRDGKYADEYVRGVYQSNLLNLSTVIDTVVSSKIKLFRISSSLFPLADQVDRSLWDNEHTKSIAANIGEKIRVSGLRVTTHPGQFCVLSSDSDKTVENSVKELELHGWLFDQMGLARSPQYCINVHGGKSDRSRSLINVIKSLPDSVRLRLTLENDETAYSAVDLLEVHTHTGVPIVWDSHHHSFNTGELTELEAHEATLVTWPTGVKPLQHISNTEPGAGISFSERRKHSQMIHYVPSVQLTALRRNEIDVDVEAKQKNVAVFKMASDFSIPL